MAVAAQIDIQSRKVEVKREQLLTTLKSNKDKHIQEYNEAKAGYKSALLSKLDAAFEEAKKTIEKQYNKRKEEISELTDDEISEQTDYIRLLEAVNVHMKVPRSFAKAYESAIDIFTWDVRETIELTYAEFTCFVRDEWEWKSDFLATSKLYNNKI